MKIDGVDLPDECPICGSEVRTHEQSSSCPEYGDENGFISYGCGMELVVTNHIELEASCENISKEWVRKRNAEAIANS